MCSQAEDVCSYIAGEHPQEIHRVSSFHPPAYFSRPTTTSTTSTTPSTTTSSSSQSSSRTVTSPEVEASTPRLLGCTWQRSECTQPCGGCGVATYQRKCYFDDSSSQLYVSFLPQELKSTGTAHSHQSNSFFWNKADVKIHSIHATLFLTIEACQLWTPKNKPPPPPKEILSVVYIGSESGHCRSTAVFFAHSVSCEIWEREIWEKIPKSHIRIF